MPGIFDTVLLGVGVADGLCEADVLGVAGTVTVDGELVVVVGPVVQVGVGEVCIPVAVAEAPWLAVPAVWPAAPVPVPAAAVEGTALAVSVDVPVGVGLAVAVQVTPVAGPVVSADAGSDSTVP